MFALPECVLGLIPAMVMPLLCERMPVQKARWMALSSRNVKAEEALAIGLVDELQLIVCPIIVGGGKRFFPEGVRLNLLLLGERRFGSSVVVVRYKVRG